MQYMSMSVAPKKQIGTSDEITLKLQLPRELEETGGCPFPREEAARIWYVLKQVKYYHTFMSYLFFF